MKSLLSLAIILLLGVNLPAWAAPYAVAGSGSLSGSLFNGLFTVSGTWTLQGLADYEAGSNITITGGLLNVSLISPVTSQSSHEWNSSASYLGGDLWSGTGEVINCQGGQGCLVGDRSGIWTLTERGNLHFDTSLFSSYVGEGDLLYTGTMVLTEVPLPAAAWLMASGLLGLSGWGRIHRRPG